MDIGKAKYVDEAVCDHYKISVNKQLSFPQKFAQRPVILEHSCTKNPRSRVDSRPYSASTHQHTANNVNKPNTAGNSADERALKVRSV